MKKTALLNAEISYLVSSLGHTDEITIADAGLPIPSNVNRIDLALTRGVPSFIQTVETVLTESQIEGVVIAEEMKELSPTLHQQLLNLLEKDSLSTGKSIQITYVPHEVFKLRSQSSKSFIRTGECTPYANVTFQAGVAF